MTSLRAAACLAVVMSVTCCGGGGSDGAPGAPPVVAPPSGLPPPVVPPSPPVPSGFSFAGAPEDGRAPLFSPVVRALVVTAVTVDRTKQEVLAAAIPAAGRATLSGLDPSTLASRWTIGLSSPASRIVVTDDGQFAYLSLPLESAVAQFSLVTRAELRRFSVNRAVVTSYAMDIAPRPGHPDTVAVAIGSVDAVAPFTQLAVFDAGVRRARTLEHGEAGFFIRASEIEFVDADTIIGFDNETTAFTLSRLALDGSGLLLSDATEGGCCFSSSLQTVGSDQVFHSAGFIFDASSLKARVGYPGVVARPLVRVPEHDSVVSYAQTADGESQPRIKLDVTVYDTNRGYLKRVGRINEPSPWSATANAFPDIVETLATADFVIAWVQDRVTGDSALLSTRLVDIPPKMSPAIAVRVAAEASRQAIAVNVPAHDLAYAGDLDRLLAAVPGEFGPLGSSLAVINPATGAVDRFILLSSPPFSVFTSGRDGLAYVTLPNESALQQVDLRTGQLGWKLQTDHPHNVRGLRPSSYRLQVSSVAFKPDDPSTLALAIGRSPSIQEGFLGVALARDGALLGALATGPNSSTLANVVAFNGANEVVGIGLQTTSSVFSRFAVSSNDLIHTSTGGCALRDQNVNTDFSFGRMYSRESIADVNANALVALVEPEPRLLDEIAMFDADRGAAYYLEGDAGTVVVQRLVIEPSSTGVGVGARKDKVHLRDGKLQITSMGRHSMIRSGASRVAVRNAIYATGQGEIYFLDVP